MIMSSSIYYNNTSGYNPLFLAVHNGEINLHPSLFEKYSATETVLRKSLIMIATARGHEEIVRLLMKTGADINSALPVSIKENQPSVFHLLVKECDVNTKNSYHETPLHLAVAKNRIEFVKVLIQHGANVNALDRKEKTPLNYALVLLNVQIAEILFTNGAVISKQYWNYWGHLDCAVYSGNLELVKLLMTNGWNKIEIDTVVTSKQYCNHLYPFRCAANKGNLEMVKLLMTNGWNRINIDSDVSGNGKCSPLYSAVSANHLKVVKYLMKNGPKNKKTINEDRLGLLDICLKDGMINIFIYLIDSGIKTKKPLLERSAFFVKFNFWNYLLTCRSRIDTTTYFTETKLHWAIRAGELETVKIILNKQANTVEPDSLACKLAVYIAVESGNEDILQVLLNAGYSPERCYDDVGPLHLAATYENTRLMEILLNSGANINSETTKGLTPLHFAASSAQLSAVQYLLERGADASKCSKEYNSPLSFALKVLSRSVITPMTFTNLVKITKMLILKNPDEHIHHLLYNASEINVYSDENSTLISNAKGQRYCDNDNGKDDANMFRKVGESEKICKFVKCIFNYLKDGRIKRYLQSEFDEGCKVYDSFEVLNILIEYDDSESYFIIEFMTSFASEYKSQLLLIDYSGSVNNLLNIFIIDASNSSITEVIKNIVLLKLMIARLVLLTNSHDSRVLEFCAKYKLLDWHKECIMQKVIMRGIRIADNMNVTFYDILSEPVNKVANYVRNENFLKIIESSCDKFPAYTDFLKLRVERGIRRKEIRDECTHLMYNLIRENHKIQFSNADLDEIFQYLSIVDLRRFLEAFS